MRNDTHLTPMRHILPYGAELLAAGQARFRLWAPAQWSVGLVLEEKTVLPMMRDSAGVFTLIAPAQPGTLYRFQLDNCTRVPDPWSRFQPRDVNGPSQVIDPAAYTWVNTAWCGRPWEEAVICEVHTGCYTSAGTFAAMRDKLPYLVDTGFTALELMPVAEFPGRFNWGYDGVLPYAPDSSYGAPEDLKRLIDEAHGHGLMVILDVVYNHFGPNGNYLGQYAPSVFTSRHKTPWGDAIDFANQRVRELFVHNALYWLNEYRFDGLRLDAVHAIPDDGPRHIVDEIAAAIRGQVEPGRHVHLILENDANRADLLARDDQPHATAQWNDDYHHAAHVLLTGESDRFYADYATAPVTALGRALAEGFVFQGEASAFRKGERRGQPSAHLPPVAFVNFLQNHDHIGNRADSARMADLAEPERRAALTAITLLAPPIPLLFMGEEWDSRTPFHFFCDYEGALADAVREGRRKEFPCPAGADFADPTAHETFAASKLDWADSGHNALVKKLLAVRRAEIVPRLSGPVSAAYDVRVERALRVQWVLADGAGLTLTANLSDEPIAAAEWQPAGRRLYPFTDRPHLGPWSVRFDLQDAES